MYKSVNDHNEKLIEEVEVHAVEVDRIRTEVQNDKSKSSTQVRSEVKSHVSL
jgi:hypothetical protein